MNILVTGKSGTGKTTLCSKLVDSLKKDNITCGGVLCPGNYAIDLITNEKRLFLDKEGIKPHKYSKVFINEKGLDFAIKAVKNAINKCNFIVVDEYGFLEFRNKGLAEVAENSLHSGKNTLIIVREGLKDDFLKKYSDFKFEVFDISKGEDLLKIRESIK